MARVKRARDPDEALEHTNKRPRLQLETQLLNPVTRRNIPNNNEEGPGRPGPTYRAPPLQLPLQQPEQARITRQQRKTETPNVQLPSVAPEQGRRTRPRLRLNPPKLPNPSPAEPEHPDSSVSETSTCYSQRVGKYDVNKSFEAVGTPQTEDFDNWGSIEGAAEFIRSHSGLEENWVGVRPLGKGGYGIAGLWELRGDDGRVIDQIVIKDETHPRNIWQSKKSAEAREVPSEVKIMSKLNKTKCHAIPRLINYKRYPHVYKHRIYMEYCPFKDLHVLCKRYRRFRRYLPEPFLWDTFYHLTEAAVAMKNGPEGGGWDFEVVHRDLKPANIFLGNENPDKGFPFYPVAKLGDFGIAVMTNGEDPRNPNHYVGPGTRGYKAPEQLISDTGRYQNDLSAYTNIWAIGATMFELLTLYRHADYMHDPAYNRNGIIKRIATNRIKEYSKDLRHLIKECIHPNPLKRITLGQLRSRIESNRDRINALYTGSDDEGNAEFEARSLLYYVGNDINNMKTGTWEPQIRESPSKPESVKFPERDFPVVFPRFEDGPETEGDDGDGDDDSDDYSDSDDALETSREDGGWEELGGLFSDGRSGAEAGDGSDDGSVDMDVEVESPVSPAPPSRQVPAPAPLLPAAPAPVPPPVPAAPPAPAVQLAPRRLRSGRVVDYF